MKFIADVMLGRLAKRLRLLGFDVSYDRTLDDNQIIQQALEESRTILTRDSALSKRPLANNHLYIRDNDIEKQVTQVLESGAGYDAALPLTRCSECNEPLSFISRDQVRDLVPDYVFEHNREFLSCSKCGRIYWKGSHTKRMALRSK